MPEWMRRLLEGGIYFDRAAEGDRGGDPATPPPAAAAAAAAADDDDEEDEDELSPKALAAIKRLRAENKRYRLSAKELGTKLEAEKAEREKAIKDAVEAAVTNVSKSSKELAEGLVSSSEKKLDQRLSRNAQKSALTEAGCVDVETGLKIIDASGISVNDDGDVIGVAEAITKLKEAKPYLFKATKTASTHGRPAPADVKVPDARAMTKEERAAKARELGLSIR